MEYLEAIRRGKGAIRAVWDHIAAYFWGLFPLAEMASGVNPVVACVLAHEKKNAPPGTGFLKIRIIREQTVMSRLN